MERWWDEILDVGREIRIFELIERDDTHGKDKQSDGKLSTLKMRIPTDSGRCPFTRFLGHSKINMLME